MKSLPLVLACLLCACGAKGPTAHDPVPSSTTTPAPAAPARLDLVLGSTLLRGYDIGVDTSQQERSWLIKELGQFRMSYPSRQQWGAVFITHGSVTGVPRQGQDVSDYTSLVVDLRGLNGDETIGIGIKSVGQPDDGSELVVPQGLSTEWRTYRYPLRGFVGADLKNVWVMIEFVFLGPQSRDVFFRDVRYERGS